MVLANLLGISGPIKAAVPLQCQGKFVESGVSLRGMRKSLNFQTGCLPGERLSTHKPRVSSVRPGSQDSQEAAEATVPQTAAHVRGKQWKWILVAIPVIFFIRKISGLII